MQSRGRRRLVRAGVGVSCAVAALALAQFVALVRHLHDMPGGGVSGGLAAVPAMVASEAPATERTVDVYAGYGTWVDVYDFLPSAEGAPPKLTARDVDEMAASGVRTLYLQAAQLSERSPSLMVDQALVGQLLVRARRHGMQVVGWYLPKLADLDRDLAHLRAISDFEVLGHRFDGVAVDIEWTGVADPVERSNKLVELSRRLRSGLGDQPLGAIVLPPVQLEVVNTQKWPDFPWRRLRELYDVWLPMAYWTERLASSGYQDGARYTTENVERLRHDLGDDDALVHVIGGVGDEVTGHHASRFAQAIGESGAIGGSIYDWATTQATLHHELARRLNQAAPD